MDGSDFVESVNKAMARSRLPGLSHRFASSTPFMYLSKALAEAVTREAAALEFADLGGLKKYTAAAETTARSATAATPIRQPCHTRREDPAGGSDNVASWAAVSGRTLTLAGWMVSSAVRKSLADWYRFPGSFASARASMERSGCSTFSSIGTSP